MTGTIPGLVLHPTNADLPNEDNFIRKVQKVLEVHICEEEFGIS